MTERVPRLPVVTFTAAMCGFIGYAIVTATTVASPGRMLPWVLARGLGLGAYLGLTALTAVGLWLRHPWRWRWRKPAPLTQLWVHASLAAVTGLMLAGHIVAICLDRWAGVGWRGAFVPGASSFRPAAVTLGTTALYLGLLVGLSVPLAGRVFRRAWLPVHRLALGVFALSWAHGVLAGSDTSRLRPMYVATGAVVAVLALTRRVATQPAAVAKVAS